MITDQKIRPKGRLSGLLGLALLVFITIALLGSGAAQETTTDRLLLLLPGLLSAYLTLMFAYVVFGRFAAKPVLNGMFGLARYYSKEEINAEIRHLDFREIAPGAEVLTAGGWICCKSPYDRRFYLIPQGLVRCMTHQSHRRNDSSDDTGEPYNDYTFCFYLTGGDIVEYKMPLVYKTEKPSRSRVNAAQVEARFTTVSRFFKNVFGDRYVDQVSPQLTFLYTRRKRELQAAFEAYRSIRPIQETLYRFQEFLPPEALTLEQPPQEPTPGTGAFKQVKAVCWMIFILALVVQWLTKDAVSFVPGFVAAVLRLAVAALMFVRYGYEMIDLLAVRVRALRLRKEEGRWNRGWTYWNAERSSSLFVKIAALVFWGVIFAAELNMVSALAPEFALLLGTASVECLPGF